MTAANCGSEAFSGSAKDQVVSYAPRHLKLYTFLWQQAQNRTDHIFSETFPKRNQSFSSLEFISLNKWHSKGIHHKMFTKCWNLRTHWTIFPKFSKSQAFSLSISGTKLIVNLYLVHSAVENRIERFCYSLPKLIKNHQYVSTGRYTVFGPITAFNKMPQNIGNTISFVQPPATSKLDSRSAPIYHYWQWIFIDLEKKTFFVRTRHCSNTTGTNTWQSQHSRKNPVRFSTNYQSMIQKLSIHLNFPTWQFWQAQAEHEK